MSSADNAKSSQQDTNYAALAKKSLVIGLIGLAVAAYGLITGVQSGDSRPVFAWLIGLSYWLNIGVGMLFLTMIWYLFDAGWPVIIRRQFEHALDGFKWLFLLFLPLLAIAHGWLGDDPGILWKWMNPANEIPAMGIATAPGETITVAEDAIYHHKEPYLNLGFFTVRVFLFFGIWIGLSAVMRRSSYNLDRTGDAKWAHLPRKVSTIGVLICALGSTFAAIDWFMAIEYHWFSTMYGVWFFAEGMRSSLAMTVVILFVLSTRGYLKGLVNQAHYYFVGSLMLAFTLFWAYISFSQYFLIYNANIPEETFWYNLRELTTHGEKNSWWWVSMSLIFLQFLVPFLCLLWYKTKVIPKRLLAVAIWMLVMHLIDIYWNILPGKDVDPSAEYGYSVREFTIAAWDIAMIVGVGGIMLWSFLRNAAREKPIPVRDPRILESINAHE